MKEDLHLHKIRIIVKERNRQTIGVTIPPSFSDWIGIHVSIYQSGNALILESGNKPEMMTSKELGAKTVGVVNI